MLDDAYNMVKSLNKSQDAFGPRIRWDEECQHDTFVRPDDKTYVLLSNVVEVLVDLQVELDILRQKIYDYEEFTSWEELEFIPEEFEIPCEEDKDWYSVRGSKY